MRSYMQLDSLPPREQETAPTEAVTTAATGWKDGRHWADALPVLLIVLLLLLSPVLYDLVRRLGIR